MTAKTITVAIFDDEQLKREAIARAISGRRSGNFVFDIPGWAVGASLEQGKLIIKKDTLKNIKIFLVDGKMDGDNNAGYELAQKIRSERPDALIISISINTDERGWYDAHLNTTIKSQRYPIFLESELRKLKSRAIEKKDLIL